MNDTLFIGSDTVLPLEHAAIPNSEAMVNTTIDWQLAIIIFFLGVLFAVILVTLLGHYRLRNYERRWKQSAEAQAFEQFKRDYGSPL